MAYNEPHIRIVEFISENVLTVSGLTDPNAPQSMLRNVMESRHEVTADNIFSLNW